MTARTRKSANWSASPQATVTKRYEWDMGHRLPSHNGKCRRLHGHRYVAEIDVTGDVQARSGMVIDFYLFKTILDDTIGQWDHKTMLFHTDPMWHSLVAIAHTEPENYGCFPVPFIPTAENIAREIMRMLSTRNWKVTRVRVYETPSGWAEVK